MPRPLFAICLVLTLVSVTTRGQVIWRCDFQTDLCNWQNSGTNQTSWIRHQGQTPSANTGPPSGNGGTGFYIYMEAGDFSDGNQATKAGGHVTLISPSITLAGPACFRLFYYMWEGVGLNSMGFPVGNLAVGTLRTEGNTTLFTRAGRQNQTWLCSSVTIPQGSSSVQIFVEATVGTRDDLGDIAVDDIALFNTSCDVLASQACDLNAGMSTTQPPVETTSGVIATSSAGQTSEQASIRSSTTSTTPASTTTMSPPEDNSALLFLLIPAVVIVLAIPIAIFCFLKRRKRDARPQFEPYVPHDEHEVYDELGPVSDNFNVNSGYEDIDTAYDDPDAPPPMPCPPRGDSYRDPDVPAAHAPPPPSLYITPVDDDIRHRKSSQPRPVSQHSYLEMVDLEASKTGPRDTLAPGLGLKEPGSPASQRSYLEMENQTSRSRARDEEKTAPKEDEQDYENAEKESTGDYHNASRQESALDAGAYLEPVARMPAQPVPAQAGLAPPEQDNSDADSYCDPQLGPEV